MHPPNLYTSLSLADWRNHHNRLRRSVAPESTAPSASVRNAHVEGSIARSNGIEGEFLKLEAAVPGFGGFFLDGDRLVVSVADHTRGEQARAAVALWLSHDQRYFRGQVPATIEIKFADFSFSQLTNWKAALHARGVFQLGALLLDADEADNKVRIAVPDEVTASRITDLARSIGIPSSAVAFEHRSGNLSPLASVRDKIRPTGAGIQINRVINTTGIDSCTLGANVLVDGVRYLLTASHCTANFTGPTGRVFYQPGTATSDRVGVEAINPAWSTNCPNGGTYCRPTDSALIQYDATASSQARLAQTSTVGTGNNAGNFTIGTWFKVGAIGSAAVGTTVFKTGRTTGTTSGPVTGTCVTLPPYGSNNLEIGCVMEAQMRAGGGDSGSPVYRDYLVLQPDVRALMGILVAGYIPGPSGGNYYIYMHHFYDIESDLGVQMHYFF